MRTLTSKKYVLRGFNDKGDFKGWVLTERPAKTSGEPGTLIVNEAKFVNDGVVYYLCQNGTYNVGGKSYSVFGVGQPAYAHLTE